MNDCFCVNTTGAKLEGGREGGGLTCPFSKIEKNYPNFGQKCPDCGHLCFKFLI